MTTTEERNQSVLLVLAKADKPMGPTEIARQIAQPWCCYDAKSAYATACSAPITPVLKRINAVRHAGGKWTAPVTQPVEQS